MCQIRNSADGDFVNEFADINTITNDRPDILLAK
jgi:hypothetical protein